MTSSNSKKPHVVVIGGGFGGLQTALSLRKTDCEVTLVDRQNHHLFQPLLYQVATGGLSPSNIAAPLRRVLRKHKNCKTIMAEVTDVDLANKKVILADGELEFDYHDFHALLFQLLASVCLKFLGKGRKHR